MFFQFPSFDPVAFSFGPLTVRWYGVAYVVGILMGFFFIHRLSSQDARMKKKFLEDLMPWLMAGIIGGGRLGYVLFYGGSRYVENPWEILYVWRGGMSFHGGCLGVIMALVIYSWRQGISPFLLGDYVACGAPWGLFFGRIANFINGELCGRFTDMPWGVVFPHLGPWPRHPSQLYEAALEGLLLGGFLYRLIRKAPGGVSSFPPGFLTGVFFLGYGLARLLVEFFRQPDSNIGFIFSFLTMGQILSLPLILGGLFLMLKSRKSVLLKGSE